MGIFLVAIKLLIIAAFVRTLLLTGRPSVYAGIYTACVVFLNLLMPVQWTVLLVRAGICLALAMLYFWFVDRYLSTNLPGLAVMAVGAGVLAVV